MLLCLLKKRKKYIFLFELLLFSASAHGIIGLLLFVVYQGSYTTLHVDLSSKSRRPVLYISRKRPSLSAAGHHVVANARGINMQASVVGHSGVNVGKVRRQGSTTSVEECMHKTKSLLKNGVPVVESIQSASLKLKKETRVKKNSRKAEAVKRKESKQTLKNKIKEEVPKKQVAEVSKKPEKAVFVPKKSNLETKPIVAQKIAKIESVPTQVNHSAQVEPKKELPQPLEKPIVQEQQQLPINENVPLSNMAAIATQDASQSSSDGQEIEELMADQLSAQEGYNEYEDYEYVQQEKMREAIVSEIGSRWKPPKGLSKELECELRICVGLGGKVVECAINKPSGVLIYDMAARVAARAMSLPRWAWGKEFTIAFRQ